MKNLKEISRASAAAIYENGNDVFETAKLQLNYRYYIEVLSLTDDRDPDDKTYLFLEVIDCGDGENSLNNHLDPQTLTDNPFFDKQKTIIEEFYVIEDDSDMMAETQDLINHAIEKIKK